MVVDVSRSEYERICLDMVEAATKGLDLAFTVPRIQVLYV